MRDPNNIKGLLELPIDLMGLIFYKKSPRNVSDSAAKSILKASKGRVERIGVFVDEELKIIVQKIAKFELTYVQLHGKESPDYCYELLAQSAQTFGCNDNLKIIKAFSVDETFDFSITKDYAPYCKYFLFDTKGKNPGGNGLPFDWTLLKKYKEAIPFLLSGGLSEDAAKKIKQLDLECLAGVDLNSRFEIEAGLKDPKKVKIFITALFAKKEMLGSK